tara:strand:+ start:400 stop:1086 length:687 start_codon:yes stop_codon:yes gene_type:complete
MSKKNYPGWELKFFDNSKNFRSYQFDLIKNYLHGQLAEIGPGNGINLLYYIDKPSKIDLFEPSKKHYSKLRKNFKKNKKVKIKNLSFAGKGMYDTILYLDVIEHIKNDKKEIIKAFRSLKKGGNLVINVPAFQHLYSNFDRDVGHFKRYNKKDFEEIFKNLRFSSYRAFYYDSIGYFLSLMSKLIISNYKNNFEKKIKLWDSCIWISRLLDKIIFNRCGKSLLLIIKK